jgi:hypothetical protein
LRIIELVPAWPPTASCSTTTVERPSEDAPTAAASPAGPAPTTATSNTSPGGIGVITPKASTIWRLEGLTKVDR